MKVIRLMTLAVFLSALISCGDGMDSALPESSSSNITVPTQDVTSATKTEVTPVSDAISTTTPAPNLNTAALNPAHGQPGHRCDIAVGQPLNSKPAVAANPLGTATPAAAKPATVLPSPLANPTINPVTNPVRNVLPTTPTGAGLNPRHGQPGHRCDIKVGAPLNGPTLNSTPSLPTTPALSPLAAPTPAVAPGMNPAHGQPGHRCDIAVGKPLNSKPAK
jgi:hypothetical protein